jgi:hypothetical protein
MIKVEVLKDYNEYASVFETNARDYEEVMLIDQFVKRFLPGHYIKTVGIKENNDDEIRQEIYSRTVSTSIRMGESNDDKA